MRSFRVRAVRQLLDTYMGRRLLHTENEIYKPTSAGVPSILGEVITAILEGKGRGVIARHSVAAGDLLMCARPAVVIEGPPDPDAAPDASQLVPALVHAANATDMPQIRAVLKYLYDGTDASRQLLPDLATMMNLPNLQDGNSVESSNSSSSPGSCGHNHSHQHYHHDCGHPSTDHQHDDDCSHSPVNDDRLTDQQASEIIKYNAFQDDYEDLAAAAVRGAGMPHSHIGLWPQFALFNHSCLPNTVHYLVGHALVVRAVDEVAAGEELTVSYLGREEFAPAAERQALLQERYAFSCSCPRCVLEQQAPQELQQLLQRIYTQVTKDLKPGFMATVEHQDRSGLAQVQAGLINLEDSLSVQLQQHRAVLSDSAVLVLQAAVYDLYELLLFCEQLIPQGSASEMAHTILGRLGRCLAILNCVSKGAELHVYLASRMLQYAVNFRGADAVAAQAAAQLFLDAHKMRYGSQLDEPLLMQLMEANKQAAEEFLM